VADASALATKQILDATLPTGHNVGNGPGRAASRLSARGDGPGVMPDLLRHPLLIAALWFAAIFALLSLAILALRRWRGDAADDRPDASELLTKFREVHARGGLSDDEYRTIKTKLASELQAKLSSNDQTS
jgi:uncharacterized membrane protein